MRGRPAPLAPLSEEQRRFAEQHHDLILAFLGKNGYAAGDYYDAAALGFLQAVQRYLTQPGLRRYAFPTIAWRAMARGVAADHRAEARRRNAEQRYFESAHAEVPCPYAGQEERLMFHELMTEASGEQRRLAQLRIQGYSLKEAAHVQAIQVRQARKLLDGLRQLRAVYL